MSCEIITGLNAQSCRTAVPGITKAYIANFENIEDYTMSVSGVTDITMVNGKYFYEFVPNKDQGTFNSELVVAGDNGGVGFNNSVTLVFSKNEQDDLNNIKLMSRANLCIIVLSKTGKYYAFGLTDVSGGCILSEGNFESGAALGDNSGWTLTFNSSDTDPYAEVDASVIPTIIEA